MNTSSRPVALLAVFSLLIGLAACAPAARPTAKAPATPVAALKSPTAPAKPTTASKPTPAPTVAAKPTVAPTQVTSRAQLGEGQMAGALMITPAQETNLPGFGSDKPQPGKVFLSFNLVIVNTSTTESLPFDPAQLSLAAEDSQQAYPTVTLKAVKDQLSLQTLKPGAKLTGVVIFEVPEQHAGFDLKFKAGPNEASWKLGA